jgi:hypothetical protein
VRRDERVKNPQSEAIWNGRLHAGDEPGIHGDADYCGLATELPATLTSFAAAGTPDDITFVVIAEGVKIYPPYPGHKVTVLAFEEIAGSIPPRWRSVVVGEGRLVGDELTVATQNTARRRYFSVRVEIDTEVAPGLYDDFVLTGLALRSTTHYADFGFRA